MNNTQHQDSNDSANSETADDPTGEGWQRHERHHNLTASEPMVSVRMNDGADSGPAICLLKVAREKLGEPSGVRLYHDGEARVAFEPVDDASDGAGSYTINDSGDVSAGVIWELDSEPDSGRYRLHYESDTGLWYADLSEDPR